MIDYYITFKEDVDADGLIRSLGYDDRKSYYIIQGKNNAFTVCDSGDNRELIKLIRENYDCHVKAKAALRLKMMTNRYPFSDDAPKLLRGRSLIIDDHNGFSIDPPPHSDEMTRSDYDYFYYFREQIIGRPSYYYSFGPYDLEKFFLYYSPQAGILLTSELDYGLLREIIVPKVCEVVEWLEFDPDRKEIKEYPDDWIVVFPQRIVDYIIPSFAPPRLRGKRLGLYFNTGKLARLDVNGLKDEETIFIDKYIYQLTKIPQLTRYGPFVLPVGAPLDLVGYEFHIVHNTEEHGIAAGPFPHKLDHASKRYVELHLTDLIQNKFGFTVKSCRSQQDKKGLSLIQYYE